VWSVLRPAKALHFFGEASEQRPWAFKREDRPAVFAGRSELLSRSRDTHFCLHKPVSYPALNANARHRRQQPGKSAEKHCENFGGKHRGSLQRTIEDTSMQCALFNSSQEQDQEPTLHCVNARLPKTYAVSVYSVVFEAKDIPHIGGAVDVGTRFMKSVGAFESIGDPQASVSINSPNRRKVVHYRREC
jgi:hypothetical protein